MSGSPGKPGEGRPSLTRQATRAVLKKTKAVIKGSGIVTHSNVAGDLVARQVQGGTLSLRESVFLAMTEPTTSIAARWIAMFTWLICSAEAVCTVVETVEAVVSETGEMPWLWLKALFNGMFTIEGCIRLWCFMPRSKAWRDPFLWLDALTMIPFYVRLFVYFETVDGDAGTASLCPADRSLLMRVAESLVSFRLLKVCRYYEGAQLLTRACVQAAGQLLVPLFMLLILVYNFSSLLFEVEWEQDRHDCVELWAKLGVSRAFLSSHSGGVSWGCDACAEPDPSPLVVDECTTCGGYPPGHPECLGVPWGQTFEDIPHAIWYNVVTITTVGYGDVYPETMRGRLLGLFIIIAGVVLFLPIPLAIVGNTFTQVWDENAQVKLRGILRQMLSEQGISPTDFTKAFLEFDEDGNGTIERDEFYNIIENHMELKMTKKELRKMWRSIDVDGDGSIDIKEFADVCFPDADVGLVDAAAADIANAEGEGDEGDADEGGGGEAGASELQATVARLEGELCSRIDGLEQELEGVRQLLDQLPHAVACILASGLGGKTAYVYGAQPNAPGLLDGGAATASAASSFSRGPRISDGGGAFEATAGDGEAFEAPQRSRTRRSKQSKEKPQRLREQEAAPASGGDGTATEGSSPVMGPGASGSTIDSLRAAARTGSKEEWRSLSC